MIRIKRGSETVEGKAKKLKWFIPAGTVLILAVVLLIVLVIGRRFRATTMKLLSFEGTVTLSDAHGRDVAAAEGKRLLDGNIVLLGRNSDMIKINGNRIEPAEIEASVKQVLGISWAAARGFEEAKTICLFLSQASIQ